MLMIPYGRQAISEQDIEAVVEALRSDYLTQGPIVTDFEARLASYCKVEQAVMVSNATVALHLAYLALDIGKGDIVWTSPNTFLSTANAALMCGASVDFVDICPDTYNMSVVALEKKLVEAEKVGKLPKLVVPVHFAGQSCDMKKIHQLSLKYQFHLVEDAAHAIGGKYKGKPVGCCEYSDICVFSFHPVKIVTTGEGGALTTNDERLAEKIKLLRTHGVTRDESAMSKVSEGPWYYQMLELGFNYRITDIQCALGLSQLNQLDEFVSRRHDIYNQYALQMKDCDQAIIKPFQHESCYSSLHLYPIQVPAKIRKALFNFLRVSNIGVNVHYIPIYLQPFYEKLGFKKGFCPNAEKYYYSAISLPMFPNLTGSQLTYVVEKLKEGIQVCD